MLDAAALLALARTTPNRGRSHIYLGDPRSDGADKTTVEPGNAWSPGLWTCGITTWTVIDDSALTPAQLPDDAVGWVLTPPLLTATWRHGPLAIEHRLTHVGGEGSIGVDAARITVRADRALCATLALAVTDVGPAGGKIGRIAWDAATATLTIDDVRLVVDGEAACLIAAADAVHDAPAALLTLALDLPAGGERTWWLRTCHDGLASRAFARAVAPPPDQRPAQAIAAVAVEQWRSALPARIFAPDPQIAAAWERCAHHLLAAAECGLPRINAVDYPLLWMRDGVIIARAFDLLGRADLARAACDHLAPLVFSGGFGAESDAPGEGLWALVAHARLGGDRAWLATQWPHLCARVTWIERMLAADRPLRAVGENRMPRYLATPGMNVACLAASDGVIRGRMDWHSPDFYINAWTVAGLRAAAEAAALLGQDAEHARWAASAVRLEAAMARVLIDDVGSARGACVTPWPTGVLADDPGVTDRFAAWFRRERLTADGARRPEPEWTYFEAAQLHNALLHGLRAEAWIGLDGMLAGGAGGPEAWQVAAYGEGRQGSNESLPFANSGAGRGWLRPDALAGNLPHNWTTAEMIALLRDAFITERDGGLVLGLGVPRAWMAPGSRFGVSGLPTDRGPVTYTVTIAADGTPLIDWRGPGPYRCVLPT